MTSTAAVQAETNPREHIGANNPPEPVPYVESRETIDGLMMEARNWLDGEPVTTQAQADGIARLMTLLREAMKTADTRRKAEAEPHDLAKAEIQTRWNKLLADNKSGKGSAVIALEVCRSALAPFELAQKVERERVAAEARERAAQAARDAQLAAQVANRASIEDRERADRLEREAKAAQKDARKAESAKSATVGANGRAMAVTARTKATVTDLTEFAEYLFRNHNGRFRDLMQDAATALNTAGVKGMPGVTLETDHSVR